MARIESRSPDFKLRLMDRWGVYYWRRYPHFLKANHWSFSRVNALPLPAVQQALELGYLRWPKALAPWCRGRDVVDVGCGMGLHGLGFLLEGARRPFPPLPKSVALRPARAHDRVMEIIHSAQAPAAIGPYSQAVRTGNLLFASGQIPIDPATGKIEATDFTGQTQQVLTNIKGLLEGAGLTMNHVVKCTVFLKDMADFPTLNPLYAAAFGEHKPARSTFQVAKLPLDSMVEIEVVAEYPG